MGRYGACMARSGSEPRLERGGHAPATPPGLEVAGPCGHGACGVPALQQLAEEQIAEYERRDAVAALMFDLPRSARSGLVSADRCCAAGWRRAEHHSVLFRLAMFGV